MGNKSSGFKYYLIAGEKSGDLHGSNLIKALRKRDPDGSFRCWGGELMEEAGAELVHHYNELAYFGIWEVFIHLRTILKLMKECKSDVLDWKPDVLILIDYPGFNLRMAKFAHLHGIRTFYYISPKVWAWNQKRAWKIKEHVDRMFVILPFEKEFYAGYDYPVDYVGNPLMDSIGQHQSNPQFRDQLGEKPVIALLPGSRKQEIRAMTERMLSIHQNFPAYRFVVAGISNLPDEYYEEIRNYPDVGLVYDQTYDLLQNSHAALVTSGTATLETALFHVPQVVCYRLNPLSYLVGRLLIKIPYISLVNLIVNRELVKELIQGEFNAENLHHELEKILGDSPDRRNMLKGYEEIDQIMGSGSPSNRAADLMMTYLRED